jgi:hypothetical protein
MHNETMLCLFIWIPFGFHLFNPETGIGTLLHASNSCLDYNFSHDCFTSQLVSEMQNMLLSSCISTYYVHPLLWFIKYVAYVLHCYLKFLEPR